VLRDLRGAVAEPCGVLARRDPEQDRGVAVGELPPLRALGVEPLDRRRQPRAGAEVEQAPVGDQLQRLARALLSRDLRELGEDAVPGDGAEVGALDQPGGFRLELESESRDVAGGAEGAGRVVREGAVV
jgi:hypothetical protein